MTLDSMMEHPLFSYFPSDRKHSSKSKNIPLNIQMKNGNINLKTIFGWED